MTRSPGFSTRDQLRQAAVEFFQAVGIAGDVAAVAEELVEVDEVGEDEIAVLRLADRLQRAVELALVLRRLQHLRHAAAGEDVGDLSDAEDVALHRHGEVEQRLARRRHGDVLAVAGALELAALLADEGPRDDAADAKRIAELSADPADLVEPLQPEMLFVRADLKNGIGGGVADRLAGPDVLLAELVDDVGAGGVAVAQNAGKLCLGDQRGRSAPSGRPGWCSENSPRRTGPAGRRAPSGRTACPCPSRLRWHRPRSRCGFSIALDACRMRAGRGFGGAADAEAVHHRDFERPGAEAGLIGRARRRRRRR